MSDKQNIFSSSKAVEQTWSVPAFEETRYGERQHKFALVIPVINEGSRIQTQLSAIRNSSLPVDVIIADGGSTDGSLDSRFISSINVRAVLTKVGPGKLSSQLRVAYAWCLRDGYPGIVTMDGNNKDGLNAIHEMVRLLESGFDYIQGSRYLRGGVSERTPLDRTIANRLIHAPLMSLAARRWFTDTTNGFRAYSSRYLFDERVQPFRDVFSDYELLFYLTIRASQLGFKVGDVPVERVYPKGEKTPTKIKRFRGRASVLRQTLQTVFGKFTPPS